MTTSLSLIKNPRKIADKRFVSGLCSTSFDLTSRHTVWSLCIGGFVYWLKTNAISQNMIQRYLSLPNLASARRFVGECSVEKLDTERKFLALILRILI